MIITLDQVMQSKGITQHKLSKMTGIMPHNIGRIRKGETDRITFANLEKICIALDCTPNDILHIEKDGE